MKSHSMTMTVKTVRLILTVFLTFAATFCASADIPERPSPQRLVNDYAGMFTGTETSELESILVAFDDSTSNQIAVVTVPDLEGYTAADYAVRLGLKWGVGSTGFNNGIVVLLKPKNSNGSGEVTIQVGYGLEGAIPDIYAKRIIDGIMIPRFREGDYFQGVRDGCLELMSLASGEISEPRTRSVDGGGIASAIILIIFMIILMTLLTRRGNGGNHGNHGSNGGGRYIYFGPVGGGYGRTGGFSGGSFGGGFGGFGGGSFGGGGASGSW